MPCPSVYGAGPLPSGKPMSIVVTAGQRGDSPQFEAVLAQVRVPRLGPGRPRVRPDRVRADKAYASRKNRAYLRRRRIRCTIPDKVDQARNRQKLGSRGCRPPRFAPADYRQRHAVEYGVNRLKRRCRHALRPARRPLRGDRPRRCHQRVAVTLAIRRWDPHSTPQADRCCRRRRRSRPRARCCAPGSRGTAGIQLRG
nr:transposase [Streptomyces sp. IMTB 1903]